MIDKRYLEEEIVSVVVQIDGKKKGIIETNKDSDEKTIMELISKADKIKKNLTNKNK